MLPRRSPRLALALSLIFLGAAGFAQDRPTDDQDRAALVKTGDAIRAAFARSDVTEILAYHHPSVVKALAPDRFLVGRDAVRADLEQTFRTVQLTFHEHRIEDLRLLGDTAVEISLFTIQGTPRNGGTSFQFRGRSMVVYVRSADSPSGWASIRELIQPAP